jgi:hypothetical protein
MNYDVAISFAGEQRKEARALAECFKKAGLQVFFDEYHDAELWGEDLYERLSDVYQNQAKYCIVLVSKAYAEKVWTSHERRNAQARALREKKAYILPVRFDETELPGLPSTISYLSFQQYGIDGICNAFLRKIGIASSVSNAAKAYSCNASQFAFIFVIESNGSGWFPVVSSRWANQEIFIVVEAEDSSDGAFLDNLRGNRNQIYIAYETNVALCRIVDSTRISTAGRNQWELKLQVESSDFASSMEMGTSGTSTDELAEMRARRLLLNEKPRKDTKDINEAFKEVLISGQGTAIQIVESPFPRLYKLFGSNLQRFLEIAWIYTVFQLKLSGTVSEILNLKLSLKDEALEVDFSGRRKKIYYNSPAPEMHIHGICPLQEK